MKFIVHLGTVETNAANWLKTLMIVINLTRGVGWADAEINTNILEITMRHGYFIEWPCNISDKGPHSIYFPWGYRCFLKEEATQIHVPLLGYESFYFMGQGDSDEWNVLPAAKKETWLHCVHFVLPCSKLQNNVSLL